MSASEHDAQSAASAEDTPRRKLRWRRVALACLTMALLLTGGVAFGGYTVYRSVVDSGVAGPTVQFVVPKGASGIAVGRRLAEVGLVEHEWLFRMAIRLDESDETIKYGVYTVPTGYSPLQLLHYLRDASNQIFEYETNPDAIRITIPEGLTVAQAARLFDRPDVFVEAASDPALLDRLGIQARTCEGFLMPNTYFFSEAPKERDVVERMIAQFEEVYARLREEYPDARESDTLRLVTIASLVEEEARADDERAIIASVIYNRLDANRALELDCTLQYALGKYGKRLLSKDKEVDSPYNTYRNRGLPPGPVSNPGAASLRAAMAPAQTDYFYFVSNADGKTHTFSRSLTEHNEAVARYRREMRKQRRELKRRQGGQ
ncbi:MAG: endolytic transglycosylase MltG [Candidatus Hydrogenedentes bacterium]|nr:endolytic transglycosylase MltG [Candidatus Hydrogenedentota bacterium]